MKYEEDGTHQPSQDVCSIDSIYAKLERLQRREVEHLTQFLDMEGVGRQHEMLR